MRVALIAGAWVIGVVVVAWVARWPDPGVEQLRLEAGLGIPRAYPLGAVVTIVLFMTAEAVVVHSILRPTSYARHWGRALAAFLFSLCFLYGIGVLFYAEQLHPYQSFYGWWMRSIVVGTFALFAWSGLASLPVRDTNGAP